MLYNFQPPKLSPLCYRKSENLKTILPRIPCLQFIFQTESSGLIYKNQKRRTNTHFPLETSRKLVNKLYI